MAHYNSQEPPRHGGAGYNDARYDNSPYGNGGYSDPYNGGQAYNNHSYNNQAHGGSAYNGLGQSYDNSGFDGFDDARPPTDKSGHLPPASNTYDDFGIATRAKPDTHLARSSVPWWNPRYWTRKIWAAVVGVVVVIVVIIIAVAVTQSKKNNAYPDYSQVSYRLSETYEGEGFFDKFNYITGPDKTNGFVHYVPAEEAKLRNLTFASSNSAILRVDTKVKPTDDPNASTGRFSVRVESKNTYNNGLFLFDVRHTPYGCSTWPALWLTDDSNWPKNGEIDIMESTNKGTDGNQMALHTSDDCSMSVKRKQTGSVLKNTCDSADNDNAGCGVQTSADTFGQALNDKGGSIMAVEWRDAGIRMWQFARSSIPADITSKKPDPSTWGTATADYPSTDCNIGSHFKNNSIVVNIDLCGDLGEATYKKSGCPGKCTDNVANNPDSFQTAFWEFGTFQVYQPT